MSRGCLGGAGEGKGRGRGRHDARRQERVVRTGAAPYCLRKSYSGQGGTPHLTVAGPGKLCGDRSPFFPPLRRPAFLRLPGQPGLLPPRERTAGTMQLRLAFSPASTLSERQRQLRNDGSYSPEGPLLTCTGTAIKVRRCGAAYHRLGGDEGPMRRRMAHPQCREDLYDATADGNARHLPSNPSPSFHFPLPFAHPRPPCPPPGPKRWPSGAAGQGGDIIPILLQHPRGCAHGPSSLLGNGAPMRGRLSKA